MNKFEKIINIREIFSITIVESQKSTLYKWRKPLLRSEGFYVNRLGLLFSSFRGTELIGEEAFGEGKYAYTYPYIIIKGKGGCEEFYFENMDKLNKAVSEIKMKSGTNLIHFKKS